MGLTSPLPLPTPSNHSCHPAEPAAVVGSAGRS